MKVVLWVLLIIAVASIAGRLLGFGLGHGIAATSTAAPAPAAIVDPFDPSTAKPVDGPWKDYQPQPATTQAERLAATNARFAAKAAELNAGRGAPTDDWMARANADLARDRQVEEDAEVQAKAIAKELRR